MEKNGTRRQSSLRWAGAALAFLLAVWMALSVGRVDFGTRLMLAVCGVWVLYAYAAGRDTRAARWVCRIIAAGSALAAAVVIAMSLALNGYAREKAVGAQDTDYLVVFGAGVRGETPSLMLTLRTRTAYEYLEAHPGTRAVLSGGQGAGEDITEAEAMRRLLVGWGIAEDRLIPETGATDTIENGRYSMELIGDPDARVTAVSNAFHIFRCVQALEQAGARQVTALSAPLPRTGTILSMYLRECAAVAYHAVFD